MSKITYATNSIYKYGDVVTVTNPGHAYSTYRKMAEFLDLTAFKHGDSPLKAGDELTVLVTAMHEASCYGEVIAARTKDGQEVLIGHQGIKLAEKVDENGAPVLKQYERARLVTGYITSPEEQILIEAARNAPEWALYVGHDQQGVFFFDHQPYILDEDSLVRGLLPRTHKIRQHSHTRRYGRAIAARISDLVDSRDIQINRLQRELAEVKAQLWKAEQKLNKVKEVVA